MKLHPETGRRAAKLSSSAKHQPRGEMVFDAETWGPDVIDLVMHFVGTHTYISVASVSTRWRHAWGQRLKLTSPKWAVQSCSCLDWARSCGLNIRNKPCLLAAAEGRLDVLQRAVALGYSREGMAICERAAAGGHLEVVKWCRANGYPWGLSKLLAAEGGHLEVLQWCIASNAPDVGRSTLLEVSSQGPVQDPERSKTEVLNAAVTGGHLETARWCWQQGYRWDEFTCSFAARGRHMEVLKWLRDKGCHWGVDTVFAAALAGDLEMLEWCRANGCPLDGRVHPVVTHRGNLEVVKWYAANDPRHIQDWRCNHAAAGGHLEVLQWLRGMGCPWGNQLCFRAACGGHFEVLRWCIANGCPWDNVPADEAASYKFSGTVPMMVWATANGCPWMADPSAANSLCWHAAKGGNLEVVKWCALNYRIATSKALEAVVGNGHVHVLEWLRANTGVLDGYMDTGLCSYAASLGSLETVKWCRANGYPWCQNTCAEAARSGNLELLQWCRANGCPWGGDTCKEVIRRGDFEMLVWCRDNGCPSQWKWRFVALQNGLAEMIDWYRESSP